MLTPKRIILTQGDEEWHAFRSHGVGSSDASIISGHLPEAWDSLFALSTYKIQGTSRVFDEAALERITRGQELEPLARDVYMALTGNTVEPACFVHPELDYVRASLDGITEDFQTIVEIKCSGSNVYDKVAPTLNEAGEVVAGQIPDYYIAQMQHQLACVPGSKVGHFFMFDPDKGGILYEVLPDEEFITELLRRENLFWNNVQKGKKMYGGMMGKKIPITPNYTLLHPLEIQASSEGNLEQPELQTQSVESKAVGCIETPTQESHFQKASNPSPSFFASKSKRTKQ